MKKSLNLAKGSILMVVVLVMAALSLLGLLAIQMTVVELEIARNHRDLRENFYLAEAAAMEGIQRLLNTPAVDLAECHLDWHHSLADVDEGEIDFDDPAFWRLDELPSRDTLTSALDPGTYLAAAESRVAGGSSLITTGSRLYVNRVYGYCTKYHADALVLVGYYMRY